MNTLQISNANEFDVDDFILVGEIGDSNTEIFRVGTVNTSTGDLTLLTSAGAATTTTFAHAESTKVSIIPYNQIIFYWTAATGTIADETPTFSSATALTSHLDITPADLYEIYDDEVNSTGFGWFRYRNSVTSTHSQVSNPIPYAGFSLNTVATIFEDFDSLLNVKELNLVTLQDRFSWLNEALSSVKNKLNLTNTEYTVSVPQAITIVPGTAEYILPSDFSDLIEITDGLNTSSSTGNKIPFKRVSQILSSSENTTFYYLRGRYVGFSPTPTSSTTYYYRYRAKAVRLTSLSDYIDLPDGAFYTLKDFMLYRAFQKFKDLGTAGVYFKAFIDGMNIVMQSSVKRDANLDTWGISDSANV